MRAGLFWKGLSAWRFSLSATLFWVACVVVLAAGVHIATILLIPRFAIRDAGHLLLERLKMTQFQILPPELNASLIDDPAIVAAACPYNLKEGPLRITTRPEPQEFLSVAFYQNGGTAFFAVTDRAAAKENINILLVTPEQLQSIEAEDDPDEPVQELRLMAPDASGFVLVRSLVQRAGERAEAEKRVLAVSCAVDTSELPEN